MVLPIETTYAPSEIEIVEFANTVQAGAILVPDGRARISFDKPLVCERQESRGGLLLLRNTVTEESLLAHLILFDGLNHESAPVLREFMQHFLDQQGCGEESALISDIKSVTKFGSPNLKFASRIEMQKSMQAMNTKKTLVGSFILACQDDASILLSSANIIRTLGIELLDPIITNDQDMAVSYRPTEKMLYVKSGGSIRSYKAFEGLEDKLHDSIEQ